MGTVAGDKRHRLVVTGPDRDRLYARFQALYYGRDDVEVIKDRRVAERRRSGQGPHNHERRARERRQSRAWTVPPE